MFISSVAYSSKASNALIQQVNDLLYKGCIEYNFADNGAISKIDLLTDGIYHLERGITKIAKNLLSCYLIIF